MPQQDERSLAIIDLEHQMTEEWLLCFELEHRLLAMTGTDFDNFDWYWLL
jgi:hypothetical protein